MRLRLWFLFRVLLVLAIISFLYLYLKHSDDLPVEHGDEPLVDYHNYNLMGEERHRSGPGEQGAPVYLSGEEKELSQRVFTENGFCRVVSDKIALDRAIPDLRHEQCSSKRYSRYLPSVSVVIPVFQEHWTTLLRTVVTVTKRSPPGVIKEIILVDDGSVKDFLKDRLDTYAKTEWPPGYLKVIHHEKRVGLIDARLTGARAATGDVLLFLDSHVEAGTNWLPPLLDPIVNDYRTVVCPFIDVIDHDTFEYRAQDEGCRGAFDWNLNYKRVPRLPEDKNNPAEPFDSPIMAGGLFAISAKWFWELGGYDPGLAIWGCEQYEISFKIWMCGGRMVDAPCSRIGHIYRGKANFPSANAGDFLSRNYRRLMDVWMDQYSEYVYQRRPHLRNVDPGNLSEQLRLKKKLHCKSFDWFMKNVAFDLTKYYPPVIPIPGATGKIYMATDKSYCIAPSSPDVMTLVKCTGTFAAFEHTWHEDVMIKGTDDCWDVPNTVRGAPIKRFACHGHKGNQHFRLQWTRALEQLCRGGGREDACLPRALQRHCIRATLGLGDGPVETRQETRKGAPPGALDGCVLQVLSPPFPPHSILSCLCLQVRVCTFFTFLPSTTTLLLAQES
uniref:Polypeptide N-acetylgalactosaminyltransferase n=1 Tax=Echinococcus granulosus TaxID=6210 RepID=A0A068WL50_ECHGR|nr:polypeptide GalNAc transferase 6 [Echinococcus granulosus]